MYLNIIFFSQALSLYFSYILRIELHKEASLCIKMVIIPNAVIIIYVKNEVIIKNLKHAYKYKLNNITQKHSHYYFPQIILYDMKEIITLISLYILSELPKCISSNFQKF